MIDKIQSGQMVSTSLHAYQQAMQNVNNVARQLAKGEVDAKSMVALKVAQQQIEIQQKTLETALKIGDQIVDILA